MIDVNQLTSLISAFRVETEKSASKRAQCHACMSIAEREQIIKIQEWRNCIPLRYNFYQGTRQMKLLDSRQIRQVRDVCIFEINGLEVFL